MNGNNIIVYQQVGSTWTPIAATKSDELNVSADTIEIANADDQSWTRHIAGRKSWGLTTNWLVTTVGDIEKVLTVGTRVRLHIGARGSDGTTGGLTGYAIVRNCKVTMTRGNLAVGGFQFEGDGALA
jgi:hypothetical protein